MANGTIFHDFVSTYQGLKNWRQQIKEQNRRYRMLQEQMEQQARERAQQQAEFRLNTLNQQLSNPQWWKRITPDKQSEALAIYNADLKTLGLPTVDKLPDSRPDILAQRIRNLQEFISKLPTRQEAELALESGIDGLALEFGENYLNERMLDLSAGMLLARAANTQHAMQTGQPGVSGDVDAQAVQQTQPDEQREKKDTPGGGQPQQVQSALRSGAGSAIPDTPIGQAGTWRDTLTSLMSWALPPLIDPQEAQKRVDARLERLSTVAARRGNDPQTLQLIEAERKKLLKDAHNWGVPLTPRDIDMAIAVKTNPSESKKEAEAEFKRLMEVLEEAQSGYGWKPEDTRDIREQAAALANAYELMGPGVRVTPDFFNHVGVEKRREDYYKGKSLMLDAEDMRAYNRRANEALQWRKYQDSIENEQWEKKFSLDVAKENRTASQDTGSPRGSADIDLTTSQREELYGAGYSSRAIAAAPVEVVRNYEWLKREGHIYYDDSTRRWVYDDRAKNDIKTINARYANPLFKDEGKRTATWGKTYGADACHDFAKDFAANVYGIKVNGRIRDLPKADDIRPGDFLVLSPVGGYTSPHIVVVNPDGRTVSEFQSKKTENGKSVPIGIKHSRSIADLRSRIIEVRRPGGNATANVTEKKQLPTIPAPVNNALAAELRKQAQAYSGTQGDEIAATVRKILKQALQKQDVSDEQIHDLGTKLMVKYYWPNVPEKYRKG